MAYGILRTADATPPVAASTVVVSLILFVLVYFVVFSIGILYICKMLGKEPKQIAPRQESMPNRPLPAGQATNGDVA
jgi:cytochrome d ubiquinol oxidase subunit I